ncbi:MAG: hypothetical protein ABIK83_09785 [Candidatus Zixiibacteriota bacterium]
MRCFPKSLCLPCFVLIILIASLISSGDTLAQTGPCLNVWPDTLDFHRNMCSDSSSWQGLDSQTVIIYNDCSDTLVWSITSSENWVITEPSSGGDFDSVLAFIDPGFLPEPMPAPGDSVLIGAYLTVEAPGADNSPQYIAVNLWLTCDETSHTLLVYPSSFDFSAHPNQVIEDSLLVLEAQGDTVMFELTNSSSWLLLPVPFTPWTTPASIPFGVYTDTLPFGTYFDTIVVIPLDNPADPPVYVPLTLTVGGGGGYDLAAAPDHFNLTVAQGGSIFNLSTFVYEQSGNELYFWVETRLGSSWLDIHFPDVEYPGWSTPDSVVFDILAGSLAPGIYADTIIIFNPVDDSLWYDEVLIPVVLTVEDAGEGLATNPTSFSFVLSVGDSIIGESLLVFDLEGDSVEFWPYNYSSWLYVDTMSSSPLITPKTIFLDVRTDMLTEGTYADTVFIMSYTDPTIAVPVFLTVIDSSQSYVVNALPSSLSFTMAPGETRYDSLHVYEVSGASVPFWFNWYASWLEIDPFFPMPPYATPMTLGVLVDASSLAPGFYVDTVVIRPDTSSGNMSFSPVTVPVYVQVEDSGPALRVAPEYFEFTVNPGDMLEDIGLLVYDETGGSLPFATMTVSGSGWLQLQDSAGMPRYTPDSLYFDIAASGLTPGIYADSIAIFNPFEDSIWFNKIYVPVILTVQGEPQEYVVATAPTSFEFSLNPGESAFDSLFIFEIHDYNVMFLYINGGTWLTVDPFGMPPYTTPSTLLVHVSADSLASGQYIDSILIYAAWEPLYFPTVTVPVILNVGAFFICGDADGSGGIDIDDIVYIINYVFMGGEEPKSIYKGDVDCDGITDIDDAVYLIEHVFVGGPAPCENCIRLLHTGR